MFRILATVLLMLLATPGPASPSPYPPAKFPVRGFHLDLRIQQMTMPALMQFAKRLHDRGINTLVMEWEATYPFSSHPAIPNRYAYSKSEIQSFISRCGSLGIEVIPLQQCFGHVEYILRNYRYKGLREDQEDYSQVCPMKAEEDRALFTQLFAELAATHPSKYFHIGGDETYLLGHCPLCRQKAEQVGKSRLYIDYIRMICEIVIGLGKRPVLWADIALKYPEAIRELPKGTVFVDWNYGWDLNHFGDHNNLLQSGYEVWGACSMRSHPDNYYLTQWKKHFQNVRDFLPAALSMGYTGMIMTSWSTSGQYSMVKESESDILDLYAIRHVYPITGFEILLDAYARALNDGGPLDIESFVTGYASDHYGLGKQESSRFLRALFMTPYEVVQGGVVSPSPMTIDALLDSAKLASVIFREMKEKKNHSSFEQYRLMADIRVQYLSYEQLEIYVNSPSFNKEKDSARLLLQMSQLIDRSNALNQRFITLNRAAFFPSVLREENTLRNAKLLALQARIAGIH